MAPSPQPVPALIDARAYAVSKAGPPVDLKLDANEGPPPSPELLGALSSVPGEALRRYPDALALSERLAKRHGIEPSQVLVTAGGDEALDRICRTYLAPGRELVLPEPTFEMVGRYARLAGAKILGVPWWGGPYPLQEVLARVTERTAMIGLVSPNNPTGLTATSADVRALAQAAPQALILVDHAYSEFADEDLTPAALAQPNALVVRTLSKAHGLAGLRVGYAMGPEPLIAPLRSAGSPFSVSHVSLQLATQKLEQGGAAVRAYVARVREERSQLHRELLALGASPMASQANFAVARLKNAHWVWSALAGLGIGVRRFPSDPALAELLRITCPGEARAFERLRHALATALAPQALLFDMDGVLVDVSGSYRAAIVGTAMGFGVQLLDDEISRAKAKGGANNDWELTLRLLAAHGVESSLAEVTRRFEALYQGTPGKPGLRSTERLLISGESLARMAARLPLAIVTGRPRKDAQRFLDEAGIGAHFKALVSMDDGPLKPDPAPVRLALQRLGVARAWMLGDTQDDMAAARAAAVVPVAVLPPGESRAEYREALTRAGAARVLQSSNDFEELLP
jgi:histidinol-phosphate aminotransferase